MIMETLDDLYRTSGLPLRCEHTPESRLVQQKFLTAMTVMVHFCFFQQSQCKCLPDHTERTPTPVAFKLKKKPATTKTDYTRWFTVTQTKATLAPLILFGRADDNCEHALDTRAEQKPLKLSSVAFCFVFAD